MIETPDYNSTYEPEKNAAQYGMQVNPKTYHVVSTLEKLGMNQVKYGAPYCPCLPSHTNDTICPCRYMREMKACRCGLYVRKENAE